MAPLGAEMYRQRRLVILPGNAAIEIRIIVLADLAFLLRPERRAVCDLCRFCSGLFDDRDRNRHVTGLLLDDALDRPARGEGLGLVHQMQRNARTARRRVCEIDRRNRVAALAVGCPVPGLVGTGAAGNDIDIVGDHEGRIEAHAELADELGAVLVLRCFDPLHEGARAGACNRAQRFDKLVAAHADAVVLDDQAGILLVERQRDARGGIAAEELRGDDRFVAQIGRAHV